MTQTHSNLPHQVVIHPSLTHAYPCSRPPRIDEASPQGHPRKYFFATISSILHNRVYADVLLKTLSSGGQIPPRAFNDRISGRRCHSSESDIAISRRSNGFDCRSPRDVAGTFVQHALNSRNRIDSVHSYKQQRAHEP